MTKLLASHKTHKILGATSHAISAWMHLHLHLPFEAEEVEHALHVTLIHVVAALTAAGI